MKLHIITRCVKTCKTNNTADEHSEDYFYQLGCSAEPSKEHLVELVYVLRNRIEYKTESSHNYIVSYSVVADDYVTESERNQLELQGHVSCPAITLVPLQEVGEDFACWLLGKIVI